MKIHLIGFTEQQEKSFWKEAEKKVGITSDINSDTEKKTETEND